MIYDPSNSYDVCLCDQDSSSASLGAMEEDSVLLAAASVMCYLFVCLPDRPPITARIITWFIVQKSSLKSASPGCISDIIVRFLCLISRSIANDLIIENK